MKKSILTVIIVPAVIFTTQISNAYDRDWSTLLTIMLKKPPHQKYTLKRQACNYAYSFDQYTPQGTDLENAIRVFREKDPHSQLNDVQIAKLICDRVEEVQSSHPSDDVPNL